MNWTITERREMYRQHITKLQFVTRRSHQIATSRRWFSTPPPSELDSGFKLPPTKLSNPFTSDLAYQRVLAAYLPQDVLREVSPKLEQFGQEAISEQTHEWISNAECQQPYVKKRDVWNNLYPYDRLITCHGWKELGKWGLKNGVVAHGYEETFGPHRRIVQHAFNFIYSASSAVYSCPVSMTSGAARLFFHQTKNLEEGHPFHEIFRRLIARENGWISSQWMTERPGGSDVQNSETVATYSPLPDKGESTRQRLDQGDYLVSGYKFFCSATECDIALMLAKTSTGKLSLFVAPTKKTITDPSGNPQLVTNGIRFHRLKTKMGTKELPTAELELKNVRAWLVGPLDRGIPTIATLLNVTRTHNYIGALSCWRRGIAIAKNFARARTTINQPLWTFPMHLHLLSLMEIKFRALLNLAFFTTSLLSYSDNGFPQPSSPPLPLPTPGPQTQIILRALTATSKGVICKVSCIALQECQEAMGGVGYMDEPDEPEYNISRLYRDTAANMTWEGTTNVLSSEVVRHLVNKDHLEVFGSWVGRAVEGVEDAEMREALRGSWEGLVGHIEQRRGYLGVLLAEGREIMFSLAWVVSGILLAHDAQRDGQAVAMEVARRWILDGDGGVGEHLLPAVARFRLAAGKGERISGRDRINWDCRIVWNMDLPGDAAAGYREPVKTTTAL